MKPEEIPPILSPSKSRAIKFSVSGLDVLWCRLWVITQNRFLVGLILVFSAFPPFMDVIAPSSQDQSVAFRIFTFIFVFGVILVIMILLQVVIHAILTLCKKNPGVVGEHEFEIRDDGLWERTDVNEALYRWAGFQKMRYVGGFLFVYVGGNMVHYIPRRCFSSDQEFQDFRGELERRFKAAKAR